MSAPSFIFSVAARRTISPLVRASPTAFRSDHNAGRPHRRRHLSAFVPSSSLMEKMNVKVPSMGDSITEGTIVEWTATIGQAVKEGDVVALVETDKVTVDIKAEVDGVIAVHYGSIDDNVEVGADLYQIDTEAAPGDITPVAASLEEEKPAPLEEKKPPASIPTDKESPKEHSRKPSIHFLGKEGWQERRTMEVLVSAAPSVVTYSDDPMYGRPAISEEEMESLMLGGANLLQ